MAIADEPISTEVRLIELVWSGPGWRPAHSNSVKKKMIPPTPKRASAPAGRRHQVSEPITTVMRPRATFHHRVNTVSAPRLHGAPDDVLTGVKVNCECAPETEPNPKATIMKRPNTTVNAPMARRRPTGSRTCGTAGALGVV